MRLLQSHGALSRAELAERAGISRTTISEITSSLLAQGSIVVVDTDATDRSGSGRPAELLALDPSSGQYLGIDFGHTTVHVSVADAAHDVIATGRADYEDGSPWEQRLDVLFALVDSVLDSAGVHFGALQSIGVGVPGPLFSPPAATVASGTHDETITFVETSIRERFGAEVTLANNTRFAALAEAHNAMLDSTDDVLYVRLSVGVGGGVIVGGRLVNGSFGQAGEFGHVRVRSNGRLCRCGKDGCLETVASVSAVIAECADRGLAIRTADDLRDEIDRAHPVAYQVIRDAGVAVGRVLAASSMVLNPAVVVVGGELPRIAPFILDVVSETMRFELSSTLEAAPRVQLAAYTGNEGSLGAITALFHNSPLLADYPERDTVRSDSAANRRLA